VVEVHPVCDGGGKVTDRLLLHQGLCFAHVHKKKTRVIRCLHFTLYARVFPSKLVFYLGHPPHLDLYGYCST
jgi:hypothetical protein